MRIDFLLPLFNPCNSKQDFISHTGEVLTFVWACIEFFLQNPLNWMETRKFLLYHLPTFLPITGRTRPKTPISKGPPVETLGTSLNAFITADRLGLNLDNVPKNARSLIRDEDISYMLESRAKLTHGGAAYLTTSDVGYILQRTPEVIRMWVRQDGFKRVYRTPEGQVLIGIKLGEDEPSPPPEIKEPRKIVFQFLSFLGFVYPKDMGPRHRAALAYRLDSTNHPMLHKLPPHKFAIGTLAVIFGVSHSTICRWADKGAFGKIIKDFATGAIQIGFHEGLVARYHEKQNAGRKRPGRPPKLKPAEAPKTPRRLLTMLGRHKGYIRVIQQCRVCQQFMGVQIRAATNEVAKILNVCDCAPPNREVVESRTP